ncbi:ABC transporter permease [Kineococcus sp. SYSU DK004]|uniref:ABC transporter permease n=1 Tax=Kineococcus sp. SYSU DK004 TaxID=3383125 RepID=UPI003D7DE1FF
MSALSGTQAPPREPAAEGARRRVPAAGWALGLVVPVLLVAAWQLSSTLGVFSRYQMPPPLDVLRAAGEMWSTGALQANVAISVQRVLQGFAVGASLGVVLGGLTGLSNLADRMLSPMFGALRAVPSLAWVPLLGLWIGLGETPKIVLVAIGAFFPVFTTVYSALSHLDPSLVEVGRAYGRRGVRLFTEILLPATAPSLLSGLRLGLAQSWLFLVAAEIISSSVGLGFQLTNGQFIGRTDQMLLAIVLLAVLGKLSDVVLGLVEARVKARRG